MKIYQISNAHLSYAKNLKAQNARANLYNTVPELQNDTVAFKAGLKHNFKFDIDLAAKVTKSLSTSTSGHRGVFGSEVFNKKIVSLFTLGVASYAMNKARHEGHEPTVLIGGDTRKASRECLPMISRILKDYGINVLYAKTPVPTPHHAMASRDYNVDLAILMTASHNPWADGGFNLVTSAGAIASTEVTQDVAKEVMNIVMHGYYYDSPKGKGKVKNIDLYDLYKNNINKYGLIDWNNIKNSGLSVYYDSLNGTGQYFVPKMLKEYGIKAKTLATSDLVGPNPTSSNLKNLKNEIINSNDNLKIGLANDGDADRFGVVDEKGNFISPNDVILLVGYHLAKNKGKSGAIIRSQATSKQLDYLAQMYNVKTIETPVGFKYIGEDIIELREEGKDILVAGEESGGLTVNGHIPEKDGIIAISLIMDLVATEKKPISEILKDLKSKMPMNVISDNYSVRLTDEEAKAKLISKAENIYENVLNGNIDFGVHKIDAEKTINTKQSMEHYREGGDGVKFVLTDGSTVLIRKSGTEPLVKFYIESAGKNEAEATKNKDSIKSYLDSIFTL